MSTPTESSIELQNPIVKIENPIGDNSINSSILDSSSSHDSIIKADYDDDGSMNLVGSDKNDEEGSVSGFIRKTFNMVSDESTVDIVCWDTRGDSFIVKKEFEFAALVLPKYFRHKNFSSFVRQLNFYGFHKRSHHSKFTKFHHPSFRRSEPKLLCQIKRKSTEATANFKDNITALSIQVTDLRRQYDDLFRLQQQILYIFSRYLRAYPLDDWPSNEQPLLPPSMNDSIGSSAKRQKLSDLTNSPMTLSSPPSSSIPSSPSLIPTSSLSAVSISSTSLAPNQTVIDVEREKELNKQTPLQHSSHPGNPMILSSNDTRDTRTLHQQVTSQNVSIASASSAQTQNGVLSALMRSLPPVTNISTLTQSASAINHMNPNTINALDALGNIASAAVAAAQSNQRGPLNPARGPAIESTASHNFETPPLSNKQLIDILKNAHPDNQKSRIRAIQLERSEAEGEEDYSGTDDDLSMQSHWSPAMNDTNVPSLPPPLPTPDKNINFMRSEQFHRSQPDQHVVANDSSSSNHLHPNYYPANGDPAFRNGQYSNVRPAYCMPPEINRQHHLANNGIHPSIQSTIQSSVHASIASLARNPDYQQFANSPATASSRANKQAHMDAMQAGTEAYLATRFQSIVNNSKQHGWQQSQPDSQEFNKGRPPLQQVSHQQQMRTNIHDLHMQETLHTQLNPQNQQSNNYLHDQVQYPQSTLEYQNANANASYIGQVVNGNTPYLNDMDKFATQYFNNNETHYLQACQSNLHPSTEFPSPTANGHNNRSIHPSFVHQQELASGNHLGDNSSAAQYRHP